jgi:outer membrane usher protein PapC
MTTLNTSKTLLALFIALACTSFPAAADETIEFNTAVLDASDRQNVDLQRFSEGNFVAPGDYLLDVHINGQEIAQQQVRYISDVDHPHKTQVCLSRQQLELLALKEDALKYTRPLAENCLDISRLPGIAPASSILPSPRRG